MKRRRWPFWVAGITAILAAVAVTGLYLSDKIHLRPDHIKTAPAEFAREYPPTQLRADFAAMLAMMAHVHPSFGAVTEQESFAARKLQIVGALDHPMTRLEYWRVAAAINGEIRDGHTELRVPEEEWNQTKPTIRVLPLELQFDDQGIQVLRSFNRQVPSGARIATINGYPAPQIRDWVSERVSGESLGFRRSYAAARFGKYAWLMGLRAPYTVQWTAARGPAQTTLLSGVATTEFDQRHGVSKDQPFGLSFDGSTAMMRVGTLDGPDSAFRKFVESAFAQLARRHAKVLILDIRDNGGGASSQGDLLQSYLSNQLLPGLKDVTVKATPEVKARYRTLMPPGFRWIPINSPIPSLRGIQTAPDNGDFTFKPEAPLPAPRKHPQAHAFTGPLYLLVDANTYSSAAIFAAPLAYWRRATVVGQPTGEPLTFFGDNYEFDLPQTHLEASVSHKQFRLFGRGDPREGIQPDVLVRRPDDAMTIAKLLIAAGAATPNLTRRP